MRYHAERGNDKKNTPLIFLLDRYRQQHAELLTFAAGDSYTDAPFMALCDYAIVPRGTQLFGRLANGDQLSGSRLAVNGLDSFRGSLKAGESLAEHKQEV